MKVGAGTEPDVQLGPISNRPQYVWVSELVSDALASGGVAAAGGKPVEGDGYFFEPTILTGLSDGSRIVDEEQFGPALPVITYTEGVEWIEATGGRHRLQLHRHPQGRRAVAPGVPLRARLRGARRGPPGADQQRGVPATLSVGQRVSVRWDPTDEGPAISGSRRG